MTGWQGSVCSNDVKRFLIFITVPLSLYFTSWNLLGAADVRRFDPVGVWEGRRLKAEATGGNLTLIFLFRPLIGHGVRGMWDYLEAFQTALR